MKRHLALTTIAAVAALAPSSGVAGASSGGANRSVVHACKFHSQSSPASSQTRSLVVASATADPPHEAAATSIRCVLRNTFTNAVIYDGRDAMAGAQALLVDSVTHAPTGFLVCSEAAVIWKDGTVTTTPAC